MRRWMWTVLAVWACAGGASEPTPMQSAPVAAEEQDEASFVVVERVLGAPDDPSAALPWIVAMHGMGSRADRFSGAFDGWNGPPARLLSVQAPEAHGPGFTWFPARVREMPAADLSAVVVAQADAVAGAIEDWSARFAVEGRPVLTGFSQGGMLSYAVALRHPERVAGAVPVSGWIVDGLVVPHAPVRDTVPVRALHGVDDEILAFVPTRRRVDRLRASGFDVTMTAFDGVGHQIPPAMRATWHETLATLLGGASQDPAGSRTVAPGGPAR